MLCAGFRLFYPVLHYSQMTRKKLSEFNDSGLPPAPTKTVSSELSLCPACGADLAPDLTSGDRKCRGCGTRALGAPKPASLANATQTGPTADAHIIGLLEQASDPSVPLLAARNQIAPRGTLYLEIGTGGRWDFPKRGLMLLMERCGFRLIRKLDQDGRRGLYRRY